MFGRIVWGSLVANRARFGLAAAAVLVPAAVVTATANFALDVEGKMTREIRSHGPNVLLEAKRGARAMDGAELARAEALLAGARAGAAPRPERVELSVPGSYEEIEAALRKIGETSKTVQGRTIPVIAAREGAVILKLRGLLAMIAALILASSGLAMALALASGVAERRPEMGLLRALGATGGRLARILAAQVGILLAIGLTVGIAAGLLLSDVLSRNVFGLPATVRPLAVAVAAAGCAAMSLGASILPVRRALAVQPAAVLKGE